MQKKASMIDRGGALAVQKKTNMIDIGGAISKPTWFFSSKKGPDLQACYKYVIVFSLNIFSPDLCWPPKIVVLSLEQSATHTEYKEKSEQAKEFLRIGHLAL